MRTMMNLNDDWRFCKTVELPPAFPADWKRVDLPHTWNAADGQDGGNDYWRGTATYCKQFSRPEMPQDARCFLSFKGAAMTAEVFLNGQKLACHEGGYSTFRVDVTAYLENKNLLCVTVDNSKNDRVYPQKADFTFYGGLYRDVEMIITPAQHFELVKDGTPGIKVTPILKGNMAEITVETWQNSDLPVTLTVAGETKEAASQNGHAQAVFTLDAPHLWDGVNDPFLYEARASLPSGDEIRTRFGVRSIAFDAEKGFILNGRSYPLRGVSRHQDRAGLGSALTIKEHREDMAFIREIGANTVRLAHYQHAQEFYDLCDENGLIVWAEIPYITEHMPGGRQNTLDQMRELITQCYNHPSIICWGLSNEVAVHGITDDLMENHHLLQELCHRMDATRPTTMAHAFMLEHDSPLTNLPDIASYNLYFGWYLGELSQNDSFFDEYHAKYPDRVMGFSEYGADANPQFHSSNPERSDYTEEYQCVYRGRVWSGVGHRPWLWATHVWNLFDFAADGRDEGGKKGVNQKGLVTMDRQLRKDAFYLYKAAWSKQPFVHLCGSRYAERAEPETEIKVYSNQPEVTLMVDGRLIGKQTGSRVFTWRIPLTGEHTILATAGSCMDQMKLQRVAEPNKAYMFRKQEVVNWFDKDEIDPACFSIRDTLGALQQHPQAGAILAGMMAKMRASRGDVAQSAGSNANLQRMMAGMTLESLLKQAGNVPAEAVKSLNAALQKIRKG